MSKQKFLTLHFKRSKLFMLAKEGHGGLRFITGPTREGAVQVPDWVAETSTYKDGIKDGSIVNLTPPEPTIVYVKELPPEDPKDEDPKDEDPKDEDPKDEDPTEVSTDDVSPKPRNRKKKKTDGPAGLVETTIKAQ